MKLNCGLSRAEKQALYDKDLKRRKAAMAEWHDYFAWLPVRVGHKDCRWLETVERRGTFVFEFMGEYWNLEYRAKENA